MISALLAALFCAGGAAAQDGYWINSSGGSWAGAANWDSADGIGGGADNTAYFGFSREASNFPKCVIYARRGANDWKPVLYNPRRPGELEF